MNIRWDDEKNEILKRTRGFGFEDVVEALEAGLILDDVIHPQRDHQRILIVLVKDYAVSVPYVRDETGLFLKTAYPDRRAMRRYRKVQ